MILMQYTHKCDYSRADLLDFSIALHTLEYLDLEVDIVPWKAALKVLNGLQRSLQLTPAFGDFMVVFC